MGEPFKSRYRKADDTELLIFVTPHIVRKRDGQYIIPEKLTEREHMLEKTLAEYSGKKKMEPRSREKRISTKDSAKRERAMQDMLDKYSK